MSYNAREVADRNRQRMVVLDYQSSLVLKLAESEDTSPLELAEMLARAGLALHEDNSRLLPPLVARYRNHLRR